MNGTQHVEAAEKLLAVAEENVSETIRHQTGEYKTDALLAVIAHALIAIAKRLQT